MRMVSRTSVGAEVRGSERPHPGDGACRGWSWGSEGGGCGQREVVNTVTNLREV